MGGIQFLFKPPLPRCHLISYDKFPEIASKVDVCEKDNHIIQNCEDTSCDMIFLSQTTKVNCCAWATYECF